MHLFKWKNIKHVQFTYSTLDFGRYTFHTCFLCCTYFILTFSEYCEHDYNAQKFRLPEEGVNLNYFC